MAKFDADTLANLEKLARIRCTPEETKQLEASLSRIIDYIQELSQIDTGDVEPTNYVLREMANTEMAEDVAGDTLSREEFLMNAPDQIGGMVRVPPILRDL